MCCNKKTFAKYAEARNMRITESPELRLKFTPPGLTESGFFVAIL